MASTFDALLRLELQATGENTNTWGEKTNNNIELLADAIAGAVTVSLAGSGSLTLSTANAAADQSRKAYITFTGALTGNRTVIIPSSSKTYIISNKTTGNFTVTIKTAAGTGAVVPQNFASVVACDGTDTIVVNESNRVSKAGDTMTGFLTLNANPTDALHAATKQYVDAATGTDLSGYYTKVESDARFVNLAGSTMTGALTLPGNPTQALHAATKQYVDGLIGGSTIPAGVIVMWSGTLLTIPTGWALCNGASGTPDLRDRFVIGAGNAYSPGIIGGAATGTTSSAGAHAHAGSSAAAAGAHSHGGITGSTTLTTNQIPAHTHTGTTNTTGAHTHTPVNSNLVTTGGTGIGGEGTGQIGGTLSTAGDHSHTFTTASTGGGQGHTHTIATEAAHTHTLSIVSDGAHTHTVSTLPPFYALAFIMKL